MASPSLKRVNDGLVSGIERRALVWLAARMPAAVTPDRLTALGVFGGLVVFAGYVSSNASPGWLWLANFGLLVHWFGDSLDGTLARYRQIERPKYGYFLDQNIDLVGNLLISSGLGLSPYVRMDVALLALTGYHMISVFVLVKTVVSREFTITVMAMGPTEIRIGLIAMNILAFVFGAPKLQIFGLTCTWCDLVMLFAAVLFLVIFLACFALYAAKLRRETLEEERLRRKG